MENEVIKNIKDDINDQANVVIDQIEYEIGMLHDDEVAHYKEGLKKEQDTYLEKELNDLEIFAVTEASRQKMETKRKLLSLRESLVNDLFTNVENKLLDFRKSEAYKDYLKNKLALIKFDGGTIFCAKEDVDFIKENTKDVEIKERYFKLGGFTYISKDQDSEYDYSLDTSFKNETEWFINHSGFTI